MATKNFTLYQKDSEDSPEERKGKSSPLDSFSPAIATQDQGTWLLVFSDLISLLLAFFVLLFSMSTLKLQEWDIMSSALSRANQPQDDRKQYSKKVNQTIGGKHLQEALNLDYLSALIESQLEKIPDTQDVILQRFQNQLTLSLPGDLLFTPGNASLSQSGYEALNHIGSVLRNLDNPVEVFGHTDPNPTGGKRYPSNWELSLDRALSVATVLKQNGYLKPIIAYGAADSQSGFISSRFSQTERYRLSRRVDIIITPELGSWE